MRKCVLYKLCFVTEWSSSCEKHRCHNASVTVTAALLLLFLRMTLLLPFYTPYTSLLIQILTSKQLRITQSWLHHSLITWLLCLSGIWDLIVLEKLNLMRIIKRHHNIIKEKHMGFDKISPCWLYQYQIPSDVLDNFVKSYVILECIKMS